MVTFTPVQIFLTATSELFAVILELILFLAALFAAYSSSPIFEIYAAKPLKVDLFI